MTHRLSTFIAFAFLAAFAVFLAFFIYIAPVHAQPRHYGKSIEINSPGGRLEEFFAKRRFMVANHITPRLRVCESVCTIFLSVPGACVYPDSLLGFHQAYSGMMQPDGHIVIDSVFPQGTIQMWDRLPGVVKQIVGWPMPEPPGMKMVRGSQLIQAGYPACS